ncbi:MAG: nickel-dependent hydrogenase large subunit [Methylococcaceae bacterium]|nr:nickel-dependent hydrogenase large subunit [Methylococcaceae bacterium]
MDQDTPLAGNYSYERQTHRLSASLIREIQLKATATLDKDPLTRVGGSLAFHCTVNLQDKKVVETASMATAFRGYESLLPGRDLKQVGLLSSTASGICGGVHATASALCLEMALGLRPPPFGIVVRNLLLSCQYLNDNTMHLFILCGPDYSQQVIEATNPELWSRVQSAPARHKDRHGYSRIGDIMLDLNKPQGKLYLKALEMIQTARKAYAALGGKYPHSESIIPGGVTLRPTSGTLDVYRNILDSFTNYTQQTIAIWDDIFDFMLSAESRYEDLGRTDATLVDFGQWDHEEFYDGSYDRCDQWGEKRWSTPGAAVRGKLITTSLSRLNTGMEEFVEHSYYEPWVEAASAAQRIKTDPLGNPLSPHHPWNKKARPEAAKIHAGNEPENAAQAYSWGTCLTWDRHIFEVGAYARMVISALAEKIPANQYAASTGKSLELRLPRKDAADLQIIWFVPGRWNAFARIKARAYALAYNLAITLENVERAKTLIQRGENEVSVPLRVASNGQRLGAGMWGAGRGFLAHWAVLDDARIENYQIAIPSRINASPRSPWGTMGPCEQAVFNTPIIESRFTNEHDFVGIDIQRAIQSFDPCMTCTTHILVENSDRVINRVVDTSFPI